ncbi:hypothetical protein Bca4012_020657 [Brassica carinata]
MMAVDKHDGLPESTPREAELQRQLDSLQNQVTELHRAQEDAAENHEILSEVQGLKSQLDEHSNNKKHRFRTRVRSMPTLETPNSGGGATHPQTTLNKNEANRDEIRSSQIHDLESDSEPEPDKDAPERVTAERSSMTSYLEQMLSKKFDAI